ncbi:MAG TPA: hypothetical protein VK508_08580 [Cyclobacteriaceae bacterium]|nr:hypothetical protein [Cyclobacteriaceae bacterium]
MKKVYLLIFCVVPSLAFSQAIPSNIRAQISAERLSRANFERLDNAIVGIPIPPGRVVGDTYMDSKWNIGSLIVSDKNSAIEGYLMKYDIRDQTIEIKTPAGVRVLDVKRVQHMVWLDSLTKEPHYYVNCFKYKMDGAPLVGLMEVMVDGKRSLFKRTVVNTKSPTYVPAMDVGSRDMEFYKKSDFYYNDGANVFEIKSKRKLIESFGDLGPDVEKFMKSNRLDAKSAGDLTRVFEFYNSKLTPAN